jgi:hypothetical protein
MHNDPQFGLTAKGRAYLDAHRRPRSVAVNPFASRSIASARRRSAALPIVPRRSADLSPAA